MRIVEVSSLDEIGFVAAVAVAADTAAAAATAATDATAAAAASAAAAAAIDQQYQFVFVSASSGPLKPGRCGVADDVWTGTG